LIPMLLTREVRFIVGSSSGLPEAHAWGGGPATTGVQPYLVVRARIEGEPDALTGYVCNISWVDGVVREHAVPAVNGLVAHGPCGGERLVRAVAGELLSHVPPGGRWVDWRVGLTPCLWYGVKAEKLDMVEVKQVFEFSAAHRLHCPALSEEENRQAFGKCGNPSGHGHNYVVEVTVAGEPDGRTGVLLPVSQFEQVVKERVIDRLDHRYLNTDCPEFAAMNPSVENIVRVIWGLLHGRFGPAELKRVCVWETPRTCAEYEGPEG